MRKYGKYSRKKTVPKRTYKKKPYSRISKALTSTIQRVITRRSEKKNVGIVPKTYTYNSTLGEFNSVMSDAVNLGDFLNLAQGTAQSTRIGNKINVIKADLKLVLTNPSTSANVTPTVVYIYIGYIRGQRGTSPDAVIDDLFEMGLTSTGWDGSYIKAMLPINRDRFIVTRKLKFKLGPAETSAGLYANNDYKSNHQVTIPLKPLMGTMRFEDDTVKHNRDLWMWSSYINAGETEATDVEQNPTLRYYLDAKFTDE